MAQMRWPKRMVRYLWRISLILNYITMEETINTLEDLQKLLAFCISEMSEKETKDFDYKYYLDFIRDRLGDLIHNLQENGTH